VTELGTEDFEAGQYLSTYLAGYATIRKFYETRDETIDQEQETPSNETEARSRAAVALVAAINSASDCIRGGLFDPKVDNVIPVDHLLVLLGEALAFINRKLIHLLHHVYDANLDLQDQHKYSPSLK
jgi:hypothetical protein